MAGFAVFAAAFFLYLAAIPDWATFNWKGGFMSFPHIRHAGYYLAAMAALGIGAMAVAERKGAWLWAWASAAAATGIAVWTGSRGAALALLGTLAAGTLLLPALRSIRNWAGGVSAMAAGLAAAWLAPPAPSSLMGLTHAIRQTTSGDVTTGRTTIWKNVIAAIEKHPLFGYGEGQMHWVAPFSTMAQPHNSILQVALAWGLVGLACVAILAIAFAWRAIPAVRREGGAMVPVCLAMTAVAILSLYDASLYYALPQSIFMASAGMVASRWGVVRPTADRSASRPARSREATWSDSATEASASSGS
jgi:O-antigen ligase